MQDVRRNVEILFTAVDQTATGFQSVGRGLQSVEQNIGNVTGPLADLTDRILTTQAAFAALSAGLLGFSLSTGSGLQSALLDLQRVMSDSEGSAADYRDRILELSNQFGVSEEQVTGSAALFRQAGFEIDDALSQVGEALTLINISELEAAEASEVLIGSLRGFGLEAEQTRTLIDALNAVSNEFGIGLGELATGFRIVAPAANAAGLSLEETIGFLTPIAEVTRSGSEAARAFRQVLTRITDDAVPVGEALTRLGVSQTEANGSLRVGADVLRDVLAGFQNLSEPQRLFTAQQLVGSEQAARFLALVQNQDRAFGALETAIGSAGSAQEELNIRLSSNEVAVNRTRTAFVNAAGSIGLELLPAFSGVVEATGDVARALQRVIDSGDLDPLLDTVTRGLNSIQRALADTALNLGDALGDVDFEPLIASFEGVGEAITNIFGEVDLSTPEGLAQGIQFVADAFTALNNVTAGIIDAFGEVVPVVLQAIDAFASTDSETQELVGQFLGFARVLDSLLPSLDGLGRILATVGGTLGLLSFAGLGTSAAGASTAIGALVGTLGTLVSAAGAVAAPFVGFAAGQAAVEGLDASIGALGTDLDRLSQETGRAITTEAEYFEALRQRGEQARQAAIDSGALAEATRGTGEAVESTAVAVRAADQASADFLSGQTLSGEFRLIADSGTEAATAIQQTGAAAAQTSDELTEAQEAANRLDITLAEIEGQERVARIEAVVDINRSQIEASVQGIQSTLQALSSDFQSSTSQIGGLFDNLVDNVNNASDAIANGQTELTGYDTVAREIRDAIDQTLTLQRDQFSITERIADAEIRKRDAVNDQLAPFQDIRNILPDIAAATGTAGDSIRVAADETGRFASRLNEVGGRVFEAAIELEIAQAQAAAEQFQTTFEGLTETIAATGGELAGLFGAFDEDLGTFGRQALLDAIEQQLEIQERAAEQQAELADLEIQGQRLRNERLRSTDAPITIDVEGATPAIELVIRDIFELIRVNATQEGTELLLGV